MPGGVEMRGVNECPGPSEDKPGGLLGADELIQTTHVLITDVHG